MRLALVIASDYHQSAQLPTLSRSLEDADRFAAYLDGSDLDLGIEELSADRDFSEQFEEVLREPGAPFSELIVYFAGYVVTAPGRDPSLILDGDRLGAFALPRLRRLLEETAHRALVVIDAVPVAHDGASPEEVAEAIGAALGRHGALSVLVNVSPADTPLANAGVGTSFTDLLVFCWDTALKSDASDSELSGLDVFESMRAEPAFDAFPAARYFPGRVDFDWATGTLESDHEISGLRSTGDDELSAPDHGFGASPGAPLPSFAAHSAPLPAPAAAPRGAFASPLPAPPEALRAAAAAVTFSSAPAVHVPPPPPRSAPPPPPRSVPPPLPRSAVPPPLPRSSVPPPPRSAVPPPLAPHSSSALPPPLPLPSRPSSAVPPPLASRPSSALPPPLPPPLPVHPSPALPPPWSTATRELEPLPSLQARLPDYEEELTEPGQPFAAFADEQPLGAPPSSTFEGETQTPTLINHGGFGEGEDTEVTTASGSLRALEAIAEAADDPVSEEASAAPVSEAAVADAVTSSDAALNELLATAVTSPPASDEAALAPVAADTSLVEVELVEGSPAKTEAEAAEAEAEGAPTDGAVTSEALTAEESLSIEALLQDTLPTGTRVGDASVIDAPVIEVSPYAETRASVPDEAAPNEAAPDEALQGEVARNEALPNEALQGEVVRDEASPQESAPVEAALEAVPAPSVGRRTLPSDFVTSVLEEAGVSSDASVALATDRLPSVLPPDLVPRTSFESHPDQGTPADVEAPAPRVEPRGALPSDLVARALAEAGVEASELEPRGERDVLEAFGAGEAEALDAQARQRQPSIDDEDAFDPSVHLAEPPDGAESSLLSRDEAAPASESDAASDGDGDGDGVSLDASESERMPSFPLEDESEAEPIAAGEPAALDSAAPTELEPSERMPSFALDDDDENDDDGEVSATRERSSRSPFSSTDDEPLPSFAGDADDDGAGVGDAPLLEHQPMPSFASEEFADDTEIYAPPKVGPAALPPPLIPPPLMHGSLPPLIPSPLPPPLVHGSLPPPLVQAAPPPLAPPPLSQSPALPDSLPPPRFVSAPPPPGLDLFRRGVLTEGDAEAALDPTLLELPPFDTCLAQGDALFAADDALGARAEYEKALEHAPADRAGVAYGRLGAVSRQLGEREAAVMNYEIALELSPGDVAPLVALTELCLEGGEYARIEGYQRRYLEGQSVPEARAEVWAAMADVCSVHAQDTERYRRILEQWAEDLPDDPSPAARLASSYHEAGEHAVAIEVRQRLAERIQDPLRKASELIEVARAVCGYLRDSELAIGLALRALELNPGAADAVEIVTTLLEYEQRWPELAAIYERIVAGMGSRALQLEVGPKLGALYRDKLGAPDRTISAYERVLEGDPSRGDVRRQLVELYTARGEHALALLHCRRALRDEPGDHELYRKAYSLLDKLGEVDAAWNAAMVLDCLGEADINEQLVADAHRPSGLLSPKGTVPEEFWGHGLLSPERDRELSEILAAVADAAVEVRAAFLRKKKQLPKLTPEARHDLSTSTTTLAKSLLWTSKLLSVKAPELYVLDEVPGELTAAPSDTPSALVSKSLARGLSLAELAFLWGRHLTLFRSEHYVAVFYPSVDDLVTLVCAALVAGDCPAYTEHAASSDIKKLGRDLKKKLHPGSYGRLVAACASFSPRGLEARVCAWLRAVELTRGRAGLLACGDVAVAAELVRRHPVVGQTPEEEQIADLLCFSVSDEYAKLRGRLGVAIA